MLLRNIIRDSFWIIIEKYRAFILVFLLAFLCEFISHNFFSLNIGQWSLVVMVLTSAVTLLIVGTMLSITYEAIYKKEAEYFNFMENFIEGLKEFIITLYYIFLTVVFSSFFVVPTGVYSNLLHIQDYILSMDMNDTFMTIHEVANDLPVNLQLDLVHSIQLSVIISIFIFIFFTSLNMIGKYILARSGSLKKAANPEYNFNMIKNIGFLRFAKFITLVSVIVIVLFNVLWALEYFLSDLVISAFLETFVMFFATNAFYLILSENNP